MGNARSAHLGLPPVVSRAAVVGAALLTAFAGAEVRADERPFFIDGFLDVQYRIRFTGDGKGEEEDQDLYQTLYLEAGKRKSYRVEFSGRLDEDVDGRKEARVFANVDDSWRKDVHFYLHSAFAEVEEVGPLALGRLGRQTLREGPPLFFDGLRLDSARLGPFDFQAFGGVPVHLYEASARADWMAGAAVGLRPWERARLRFEYAHVTDDRRKLKDGHDDYLELSAAQGFGDSSLLFIRGATLDGRGSEVEARTHLRHGDYELTFDGSFRGQFGNYRDLSIDFSPLVLVLQRYQPFVEGSLLLTKGLGEHFEVSGGAAGRVLIEHEDESPFNREWQRYYGGAQMMDLPWKGLTVGGTAGAYVSARSRYADFGLEVSQRFGEPVTFALGTAYALYKFDPFFSLEELEDVRSLYARMDVRLHDHLRLRLRFDAEKDDHETYYGVTFGARLGF